MGYCSLKKEKKETLELLIYIRDTKFRKQSISPGDL